MRDNVRALGPQVCLLWECSWATRLMGFEDSFLGVFRGRSVVVCDVPSRNPSGL